jgi:putative flippase GtrA
MTFRRPAPLQSRAAFTEWVAELARFGAVGGVAYVFDVGGFNLLAYGPGRLLGDNPTTAKIVSGAISVIVAWAGSRYWSFAGKRNDSKGRELALFIAVNVVGVLIAAGCTYVSHWVLDFTSPFADNISGNIVGVGLGTIFRYLCYRLVVFTGNGAPAAAEPPAGRA